MFLHKSGRIAPPRPVVWHTGSNPPESPTTEDGDPIIWYNDQGAALLYSTEYNDWVLITDEPEFDPYQVAVIFGGVSADSTHTPLRSSITVSFAGGDALRYVSSLGLSEPLVKVAAFASSTDGFSLRGSSLHTVSFAVNSAYSKSASLATTDESVGFNSCEAGYAAGGIGNSSVSNRVNKLTFSSGATLFVNVMDTRTRRACGFNSAEQGFYLGGCSENVQTLYEQVNTLTFATDTQKASATKLLSIPTRDAASFNARERGFALGGFVGPSGLCTASVFVCDFYSDNHRVARQMSLPSQVSNGCGFNTREAGHVLFKLEKGLLPVATSTRVSFSDDASITATEIGLDGSGASLFDASCCDSTDNNNFIF